MCWLRVQVRSRDDRHLGVRAVHGQAQDVERAVLGAFVRSPVQGRVDDGLAEAGAVLMLCARRDEWLVPGAESLRARGFTVHAMRCDVSNASDVQAVVDATIERFGTVDVLVNNAGVSWGERPEAMTLAQW